MSNEIKLPKWTHAYCEDCGEALPVEVQHSAAGYYIGQWCSTDGPYSRLSVEYYRTEKEAQNALDNRTFTMRQHP